MTYVWCAASSADHTINTLRYADRIKERTVGSQAAAAAKGGSPAPVAAPSREGLPAPPGRGAVAMGGRKEGPGRADPEEAEDPLYPDEDVSEFHRTIESLFEEEEALLNLHMNSIQESAELLTEEGRLLQRIQTDDHDIDAYAARLDAILGRKQSLITELRARLASFRECLRKEESVSNKVKKLSTY